MKNNTIEDTRHIMPEVLKINCEKINEANLEVKMKSRAIIEDNEGKLLIANYGGVYLFPGGSIDERETPNDTVIRELKEETGMEFETLQPFVKLKCFQDNYPNRDGNVSDRLLITYYYFGKENDSIKCERKLTEKENKDGFKLDFYSINEIEKILEENVTKNPRNEYFNIEMRTIIDYYIKEKNKEIIER